MSANRKCLSGQPSTTTHGGQIFFVPLFHARKAQYLRAPAFSLVDAAGHISPIFDLRVRISLFFLSCLVDVSISRSQYSSGFLRLGWTLPVARHRGVKPGECRPQAGSRHQPAALARQQSAKSGHLLDRTGGQVQAACGQRGLDNRSALNLKSGHSLGASSRTASPPTPVVRPGLTRCSSSNDRLRYVWPGALDLMLSSTNPQ